MLLAIKGADASIEPKDLKTKPSRPKQEKNEENED